MMLQHEDLTLQKVLLVDVLHHSILSKHIIVLTTAPRKRGTTPDGPVNPPLAFYKIVFIDTAIDNAKDVTLLCYPV